jgi:putative membrane protein
VSLQSLTVISTLCIVLSGASLLLGWYFIRGRRNVIAHRNTMLTAALLAALFLVFYIARWSLYGTKLFTGSGGWRILYFSTLVPHIVLAVALGPLAVRLMYLALRRRDFAAHRRLARVTLPVWLYVAVSGWMIYYLLYVKTY